MSRNNVIQWLLSSSLLMIGVIKYDPAPVDILLIIFCLSIRVFYKRKNSESSRDNLKIFLCFYCLAVCISTTCMSQTMLSAPAQVDFMWYLKFLATLVYGLCVVYSVSIYIEFQEHHALKLLANYFMVPVAFTVILSIVSVYTGINVPMFNLKYIGDRLQGFTKDPNVFGPICSTAGLFGYAYCSLSKNEEYRSVYILMSSVCLLGAVLSYSRSTWVYTILIVSLIMYDQIIIKNKRRNLKQKIYSAFTGFLILIVSGITIAKFFPIILMRASLQSYDSDRFETHVHGFMKIVENPLGYGSGQTEAILKASMHQSYIRLIFEYGIIILIPYSIMFIYFLKYFAERMKYKDFLDKSILVFISAHLFIGLFVDLLHWRYLWVLIGFSLGIMRNRSSVVEKILVKNY